jgi:hypothetical protein
VKRCEKRAGMPSTPQGMSREALRQHPTYRHYVDQPGAQCELEAGHDGTHRSGGLVWHDPPALFVGGVLVEGSS